ncbi:hypothetical protein BJX64DRAFT_292620 [Aspergillus heterothallicus]
METIKFLVHIQGKPYFLKVHHGRGPRQSWEYTDREINIHVREITAYKRLQEHGLCDRAVIPRFYGSIEDLDPNLYQPHPEMFLEDEYPPKAILLEYIVDMEEIHWSNYTDAKRDNLIQGLEDIHAAGVIHDDIYPRNMMVVKGDSEKAIWIDFDSAQTWDKDNLTAHQKKWLQFERELAVEMLAMMKADSEEGQMNKTTRYYW